MTLAKSHSNPKKKDRKIKRIPKGCKSEEYMSADELIDQVYCDICNGFSKSDILQKLQLGLYDAAPLKQRQAYYCYNAAFDRVCLDSDMDAEQMRKMFYSRYESLLQDAIEASDRMNARQILDSMTKLMVDRAEKAKLQIEADKNNKVTISFGFDDNDDKHDANAT